MLCILFLDAIRRKIASRNALTKEMNQMSKCYKHKMLASFVWLCVSENKQRSLKRKREDNFDDNMTDTDRGNNSRETSDGSRRRGDDSRGRGMVVEEEGLVAE